MALRKKVETHMQTSLNIPYSSAYHHNHSVKALSVR